MPMTIFNVAVAGLGVGTSTGNAGVVPMGWLARERGRMSMLADGSIRRNPVTSTFGASKTGWTRCRRRSHRVVVDDISLRCRDSLRTGSFFIFVWCNAVLSLRN